MESSNKIHPSVEIPDDIKIGHGNVFSKGVVVRSGVEIGSNNHFGEYSVIGGDPESLSPTIRKNKIGLKIGDGNVFREFFTVSQGTIATTLILNNGFFMRGSHVGHDAQIGSNVRISSNVVLGGHSILYPFSNLGLGSTVHQRSIIGIATMVGMLTPIRRFTGHFKTLNGNPAKLIGRNIYQIERLEVESDFLQLCDLDKTGQDLQISKINPNQSQIQFEVKNFLEQLKIT